MTLTLDKSYFSGAYTALSFSWVGMAVIVALLALAFGYWFVTLRSAPIRTSTRRLPPDAALPCDMPFLVGGGPIQFNMLVCHWASLGYLTIFCGKNGRVAPRRRVDMGNERRPAEVRLFQMLFSQGRRVRGREPFCTSARRKRRTRCCGATGSAGSTASRAAIRSLARAFGLLAGALAAAEAASPLLPAGFVRWLLLIAAFLIGGALSAVILHAPSAYYQGKKLFVALAALAAVALLTPRAVRRGSARRAARDRVSGAARASDAPRRQADGLRRRDRHAGDELPPLPAPRHAEPAALAARAGQPVFLPHPPPYAEAIGLGADLARRSAIRSSSSATGIRSSSPCRARPPGSTVTCRRRWPCWSFRSGNKEKAPAAAAAGAFFMRNTAPYAGSSGRIRRTARLSPPYTA